MGIYSSLTDEELAAEILEYREARKAVTLGGNGGVGTVKRVTDGDRTIEYTSANLGALDRELRALLAEQSRRSTGSAGRAIAVEFD
jgi:hypothetical protein